MNNIRPGMNSGTGLASRAVFIVVAIIAVSLTGEIPSVILGSDTSVPGSVFAAELRTEISDTSPGIPTLVDLGADKCVPCKMMAPILEELKKEYKGKLDVVFYDVWKDPTPAEKFKIHGIPTQIFLDETGNELYRHAGYWSKEEIVRKWKELGYDFQ